MAQAIRPVVTECRDNPGFPEPGPTGVIAGAIST